MIFLVSLFFLKFIYLFYFLAVLGLRFCARAFSSCSKRGPLFITMRGPLTIVASLVAEHRLQTPRLSSCGSQAQLLRSMWDLPRPGLEPMSPALAGRFSTTVPPGKPCIAFFNHGCSVRFSIWSPGEQYPNEARGVPLLQPRLLWSCSPPCPLLFLLTSPLPTPYPHL